MLIACFRMAQVEKGYEGSIYEHTNDLSTRDVLEEILLKVARSLHAKLINAVQPWDDRLYEATRKITRPLAPGLSQDAPAWWFRVPKNLSEEGIPRTLSLQNRLAATPQQLLSGKG